MLDFVREMRAGEEAAVDALLTAAFEGEAEARLVRALRKARVMAGEMVLPKGDGIVGYYALSWMVKPKHWLALAPVAVAPEHQGQGLGKRMMGQLTEWARLTHSTVVVLGQPEFYRAGGFSSERAARLTSPYPVEYMLLVGPGTDAPKAELVYPKAFEGV